MTTKYVQSNGYANYCLQTCPQHDKKLRKRSKIQEEQSNDITRKK